MTTKPKRPMPDDFAEVMQGKPTVTELMKRYRTGDSVIRRWRKEIGYKHERARPLPADFISVAATMARFELKNHYRASQNTIERWLTEAGATTRGAIKPVPDDFAEMAETMCIADLRKHYNAGADKIKRWLRETGATPARYVPPKRERVAVPRPRATPHIRSPYVATGMRDKAYGIFDQAADILRRERWVVYRCDDRGMADPKGDHWRAGNTILTPDELLAKAARYEKRAA